MQYPPAIKQRTQGMILTQVTLLPCLLHENQHIQSKSESAEAITAVTSVACTNLHHAEKYQMSHVIQKRMKPFSYWKH